MRKRFRTQIRTARESAEAADALLHFRHDRVTEFFRPNCATLCIRTFAEIQLIPEYVPSFFVRGKRPINSDQISSQETHFPSHCSLCWTSCNNRELHGCGRQNSTSTVNQCFHLSCLTSTCCQKLQGPLSSDSSFFARNRLNFVTNAKCFQICFPNLKPLHNFASLLPFH